MRRNTRELIVNAAMKVLARDGNAPISAIIEEAGLAKSVFFHHFKSKQDLLLEIIDLDFDNRMERIKKYAKKLPDEPGRMLKAYLMVWADDVTYSGMEEWNSLGAWIDPLLRKRLAEQDKQLLALLWEPGIPEMTVEMVLNACFGGWARNLLVDRPKKRVIESRKELARDMTRIIDDAICKTKSEKIVGL